MSFKPYKSLRHAGYFEGIGGFSLGAHWAGIQTTYTCEINDFRHKWLNQLLPNATHERNIISATGACAEIFTGGFPCQDISQANTTGAKGIDGARSGLWHEFYRHICGFRPPYVVLENSPMLVHRGLATITAQFTAIGYNAEWQMLSKQSVGFSDERERLFVVAYPHQVGRYANLRVFNRKSFKACRQKILQADNVQSEFSRMGSLELRRETIARFLQSHDGLPPGLAREAIEAYGDSVCPQLAYLVMELIKRFDHERNRAFYC